MNTAEKILRLIQEHIAPLEAKLALMSAQSELLEKRIMDLEKRIDDLVAEDDEGEIVDMGAEIEHDTLLNHLIEDNLHSISHSPNHVSLTIDLSKKKK